MIIRKEGKAKHSTNLFGGIGEVQIEQLFSPEEFSVPVRLCARLAIAPGNSIGLHQHTDEDELYFILSGTGTASDSDSSTEVQAGDSILTRSGEAHSLKNTGNEDLVLLAVIPQSPTS